nr:VOC family protein [Rhodococcus sp. (in: high G+C Gram-positive bacteria)]
MDFTVTRFDHIVINCTNVDVTAAWYSRVLGMRVTKFGPHNRTALEFGNQKINLRPVDASTDADWASAAHATAGSDDLCFVTDAAPEVVKAHLVACDVEITNGPVTKVGALGDMISHYCLDPDGNLIEISNYVDRC